MQLIRKFILLSGLIMLNFLSISAQDDYAHDSLRASLITCTPGTDIYAHFGHTALRIWDLTTNRDVVFNYGCFDSSQGDFVYKFIKGETDYIIDVEPGPNFFGRYQYMGNGVSEQVLNLTQPECHRLTDLLFENALPENCGYRYNWLYDNCTTRARDMINKAVDGSVIYKNSIDKKTARNELHECLANNSWLNLGIDLLLGTEIDTLAPRNVQQFIPAYYEKDLNSAYIVDKSGAQRKLISATNSLLEESEANKAGDIFFTPVIAFTLLLIITIFLSIVDCKRKKFTYWFDAIFHIVQGCAGIIIAYLFFFSVHPAVSTNWQVILFNPLYLLYAVYVIYCGIKNKRNILNYADLAVIILFLTITVIMQQQINPAVYIVATILIIRSTVYIFCKKNIQRNKRA